VVPQATVPPDEIDQARGEDTVQEGPEATALGLDRLGRPVLPDRLHDPQHGVLKGVEAVGLLEAGADGVAADDPLRQGGVAPDQLVSGRPGATLLGENHELLVRHPCQVQVTPKTLPK
jgi:hypothetical protein